MKYQIKNSTVTFTNQSVNTADVTGWEWYLNSGSGFSLVATTLNADITFPATAGVTCTVKLLALGPWGATEVKYEEQFMTVENIPGPVIVPKAITASTMENLDVLMEVQAGTGAGQLTWELIGVSEAYGLTMSSAGRLTGVLLSTASPTSISVKVTDQLGREDFSSVSITISSASLTLTSVDMDSGVVFDPATKKVSALKNQSGVVVFVQSVSAKQPVYVPANESDDGFAHILFSEDMHSLEETPGAYVYTATQYRAGFAGVLRPLQAGVGEILGVFGYHPSYPQEASIAYVKESLKVAGPLLITPAVESASASFNSMVLPAVGATQNIGFPAVQAAPFVLTSHCKFATTTNTSAIESVTRVNGFAPSQTSTFGFGFSAVSSVALGIFKFGAVRITVDVSGRFRLYSFTKWHTNASSTTHPTFQAYDGITQFYAKKYGIPCKKITSLTA